MTWVVSGATSGVVREMVGLRLIDSGLSLTMPFKGVPSAGDLVPTPADDFGMHVWQATITDSAGNIVPEARIEVRHSDNNALAEIYEDRDGEVVKANPFQVDESAFARFYAASGRYDVRAFQGGLEKIWADVELGITPAMLPDLTGLVTPIVEDIIEGSVDPRLDEMQEQIDNATEVGHFLIGADGSVSGLPDGWTVAKQTTPPGHYLVIHNLNQNYIVQLTAHDPNPSDRVRSAMLVTKSLSQFLIRVRSIHDRADAGINTAVEVSVFVRSSN